MACPYDKYIFPQTKNKAILVQSVLIWDMSILSKNNRHLVQMAVILIVCFGAKHAIILKPQEQGMPCSCGFVFSFYRTNNSRFYG